MSYTPWSIGTIGGSTRLTAERECLYSFNTSFLEMIRGGLWVLQMDFLRRRFAVMFCSSFLLLASIAMAQGNEQPVTAPNQTNLASTDPTNDSLLSASSLYMKVRIAGPLKTGKLKPGDTVEGKLAQDVYAEDHEVFAAGSRVLLKVDRLGQRRRQPNDHWPWVVKAFTPRHEKYPVFSTASVVSAENHETALQVRMISLKNEREVRATKKSGHKAKEPKEELGPVLTLAADEPSSEPVSTAATVNAGPVTVAAGTPARIILLKDISASKNRSGDAVQARLLEPVRVGSTVLLPEGSTFRGEVVHSQKPRMLSRAGSVMLRFTTVSLPDGVSSPIAASIKGAELDQRSHTVIDPEGDMKGERPGKAWMLLNTGVTAGIAKEVDDGTQLLIEAIVSTATDASTAGVARIAATCASGIFMLTRHGRDVVLPKFTQMEIVFDRPASIPAATK